MANKEDFGF